MDTMTIGQYTIHKERCPDGSLQIWEGDQPLLPPSRLQGGAWCGASIFPRFFYTEASAVTFVLRLLNIPPSVLNKPESSPPVLDLTYRVLPKSASVVRWAIYSSFNFNWYSDQVHISLSSFPLQSYVFLYNEIGFEGLLLMVFAQWLCFEKNLHSLALYRMVDLFYFLSCNLFRLLRLDLLKWKSPLFRERLC